MVSLSQTENPQKHSYAGTFYEQQGKEEEEEENLYYSTLGKFAWEPNQTEMQKAFSATATIVRLSPGEASRNHFLLSICKYF